jgi:hypothetical protein
MKIGETLGLSRHTVMRDWALAKAWLVRDLRRHPPAPRPTFAATSAGVFTL